MIFINFKTYRQGTGVEGLSLIKILEGVAVESQVKIIPVVQATDVKEAVLATKLEVWVQGIDPVSFGAHTGSVIAEAVLEDGASGTFLNHSEKKFDTFENLKIASQKANDAGLKTLIFASSLDELQEICTLQPIYVAYEPPEFIGNTQISVAGAQPEIIAKAATLTKEKGIPLIVGAGIHTGNDVKRSIELGAVGVAVATDIVKASDPRKELFDLTEGFK
jgi:triosephosphate isomerase